MRLVPISLYLILIASLLAHSCSALLGIVFSSLTQHRVLGGTLSIFNQIRYFWGDFSKRFSEAGLVLSLIVTKLLYFGKESNFLKVLNRGLSSNTIAFMVHRGDLLVFSLIFNSWMVFRVFLCLILGRSNHTFFKLYWNWWPTAITPKL